jgi:hypothetical protein
MAACTFTGVVPFIFWNMGAFWDCGHVPLSTDDVFLK